ncbi:hypothetical protein [Streptomyces sp. NPDC058371]|uniref:hypothetical protein n=1 Tax=Streptomyces sp. NPDC058371 TaxID=3346463 RepID=UPI003665F32A
MVTLFLSSSFSGISLRDVSGIPLCDVPGCCRPSLSAVVMSAFRGLGRFPGVRQGALCADGMRLEWCGVR